LLRDPLAVDEGPRLALLVGKDELVIIQGQLAMKARHLEVVQPNVGVALAAADRDDSGGWQGKKTPFVRTRKDEELQVHGPPLRCGSAGARCESESILLKFAAPAGVCQDADNLYLRTPPTWRATIY